VLEGGKEKRMSIVRLGYNPTGYQSLLAPVYKNADVRSAPGGIDA